MKVILEKNMLVRNEKFKINLFSKLDRVIEKNYTPIVPESIIEEIKKIKKTGSGKDKKAASVALELAKKCEKTETQKDGDDAIIEAALKDESIVATNDSELIKRLKNNNIPVIFLKQKSHLKKN